MRVVNNSVQIPAARCRAVSGEWKASKKYTSVLDPMNGESFIKVPDTQVDELAPFVDNLKACPKSGLHNPLKNKER